MPQTVIVTSDQENKLKNLKASIVFINARLKTAFHYHGNMF